VSAVVFALLAGAAVSCEPSSIVTPPLDDSPQGWEAVPDWPKLPADKKLGRVLGVAVDATGRVWFSHMGESDDRPEILALDPITGDIVGGIDASSLRTPHALAFDDEGRLWVTDDGGNRIVVFDREGRIVQTIGAE